MINPVADRRLRGFARAREATSGATLVADVWLETQEGKLAVLIEGMRLLVPNPGPLLQPVRLMTISTT